jgi:hypothetical protein
MTRPAFLILIVLALSGCTLFEPAQPKLGAKTHPPIGYVMHCVDYPDSIFCSPDAPPHPSVRAMKVIEGITND